MRAHAHLVAASRRDIGQAQTYNNIFTKRPSQVKEKGLSASSPLYFAIDQWPSSGSIQILEVRNCRKLHRVRGKNLLEQLSRTRFFTGFENTPLSYLLPAT